MLDTDTKRRIDTARDILVGKVPDPKSQVEQITIALIYKFMDDMDAESEDLGGKRKFFTNEFARFGWAKLMSPGLGGHEMLGLYADGISKMPENPGIPLLFRDIFKNAYLPYRDPETLKSFLKIIDEFNYDHSERLGDAFEYLLSVLGSQGDAGQFRTPRHIIDFMVEVLRPQKGETILDPACGTAGFLISAYKHILRTNTDVKGNSKLTPDERENLAKHIKGYDISPDMVRLSLVNLYLHGFTDPHIYEYDTLTSEERWNEFADVILANPPFMSPKGGIKPHRRFSIQAKRSEVLFVDYMAEHLTPKGRAAIIVPEGIIFQGQGAYKDLRKMLVENSLVAVVSLPAGCFNPYSGVKTSILILDKALAKKSNSVGFFKVENDGFGLGAQRRVIELNDLPKVQAELDSFLQALRNGSPVTDLQPISGLIVSKQIIAANGEYNLSGERYREGTAELGSFPYIPLADLCRKIQYGLSVPLNTDRNGFKTFRMNELVGGRCVDRGDMKCADISGDEFENYRLHRGDILFNRTNSFEHVGRTGIFDLDGDYCFASYLIRLSEFVENVDPFFINAMMNSESFRIGIKQFASRAIGQSNINATSLGNYTIPIPSLDLQKEIVAEIVGYQNVINGARTVLENYRPHIHIRPDWPIVELGELCSFKNGLNFDKASSGYSLKIIGVSDFQKNLYAPMDDLSEVHLDSPIGEDYLVRAGDILFVRSNGNPDLVGRSIIIPPPTQPTTFSGFSIRGRMKDDRAMPLFYAYFFKSRDFAEMIKTVGQGANIRNLSQGILNGLKVPVPPKEIQEAIIAEIESEQTLVYSNRELIARFEKKIQATLSRVWGEEESAPSGA